MFSKFFIQICFLIFLCKIFFLGFCFKIFFKYVFNFFLLDNGDIQAAVERAQQQGLTLTGLCSFAIS